MEEKKFFRYEKVFDIQFPARRPSQEGLTNNQWKQTKTGPMTLKLPKA
jgi:hypothetical protein